MPVTARLGSCPGRGLERYPVRSPGQRLRRDLAYLIQGPPGTGKTFVLAHLAQLLVADGFCVLVTALTHRAIDNTLNKISTGSGSAAL